MNIQNIKLIIITLAIIVVPLFVVFKSEAMDVGSSDTIKQPYQVEEILARGSVGQVNSGQSASNDLNLISEELGLTPYAEDRLTIFPDINYNIGGKITLKRAPAYQIIDGKKSYSVRSWAESVATLLDEKNIELGDEDKINFSPSSKIEDGMKIVIVRVARTKVIEKESIDYKTIKKDDPTLDKGKQRVEQRGAKGVKELTYEVVREDGVEISKTLISSEITTKAVDEIIIIGTKPVITVRCKFNDTVIAACAKYGYDPNSLCNLMIKESNGNPNSDGGKYKGLFQYTEDFWASASSKAGFGGASIWDATAQIYTTAWALTHGYAGRW